MTKINKINKVKPGNSKRLPKSKISRKTTETKNIVLNYRTFFRKIAKNMKKSNDIKEQDKISVTEIYK